MKRILIAGGAGFLGSNLCERLLKTDSDIKIFCVDNLSSGSKENIESFKDKSNFEFIEADIIEKIDINVDYIFNLACPASPVHYQKDAVKTFKTSVFGVYNLLNLANKYNATILQASTSEVYGNPLVHPQNESYFGNVNPIGLRSCYDEGKRAAETLMFDFNRKFKTKIKIARIFNTYGKNMQQDDGRVISNFIVQALQSKDITVYGDGAQTRSFCYVDDLISGLIKLMFSNTCVIGPINLGNPDEHTVLEIAKIIKQKTASKSNIVFKELPSDDPIKRKPDISKAIEILDWKPDISLDIGLNKTIEYFSGRLK